MHKQRPPRSTSRFVSLRIASEELGLPYARLYSAVKNGHVQTLSLADESKSKSRPVIYVLRDSLDRYLEKHVTKVAA